MFITEADIRRIVRQVISERKIGGHNYNDDDDEFYTRYSDIERELSNYDFTGDIVYCCCDDPSRSNFYRYFKDNYEKLGLTGLYATYLSNDPYAHFYDGVSERRWKIASGRFQDNGDIMYMCTVVVTNPPFSKQMTQQLVNMVTGMGKELVTVGPLSLSRRNDMFDLVQGGELSMGHTPINTYVKPDGSTKKAPSAWWTTKKPNRGFYNTGKSFDPDRYAKYDNIDAIECPSYKDVPDDYYGVMGVPERFLGKLNMNQFELIGKAKPILNGKKLDHRILIRRRKIPENLEV